MIARDLKSAPFLLAAEMGIDPRIPVGTSGPVLDDLALRHYRKIYHEITQDLEVLLPTKNPMNCYRFSSG
jgi:hypothetical protein